MIKRNGKRVAAIAIAATIIGQNLTPIFAQSSTEEKTTKGYECCTRS